jgi:hypothetical protein
MVLKKYTMLMAHRDLCLLRTVKKLIPAYTLFEFSNHPKTIQNARDISPN